MFRHKLFKNLYDTYLRLIGNVVTAVCQTKLYEKEIVSLSVLVLSNFNDMQLPRNLEQKCENSNAVERRQHMPL